MRPRHRRMPSPGGPPGRQRQARGGPSRRPSKAQRQAQQAAHHRQELLAAQARRRRRRAAWWGSGGAVAAGAAVVLVVALASGAPTARPGSSAQGSSPVRPAGPPDVQPAALVVANTSGIPGVVAYDTTGWPTDSHNGPADEALHHGHVSGPVTYSVTPPVGGDHDAVWLNCGVYAQPVPATEAVHDLEHGAVWITYQPSLPVSEVAALRAFEAGQSLVGGTGSRYVDLSPYAGLPSPIVVSAWGYQLRVGSPADPRLQQFVDTFRASTTTAPEPGGECTGGSGTPLQR